MRKSGLFLLLIPLVNFAFCQDLQKPDSLVALQDIPFYKNLTSGVVIFDDDSIVKGPEYYKAFSNLEYRNLIYPDTYSWEQVKVFVNNQEILQALWYFINLYEGEDKFKEIVINSCLVYEKLFDVEKSLINSFYTYAFMDKEVSEFKDNDYKIIRPDILETKQRRIQEIVKYMSYYKETVEAKK